LLWNNFRSEFATQNNKKEPEKEKEGDEKKRTSKAFNIFNPKESKYGI
jgi:hypothetical protein